jgi:hypothetical protein
MDRILVLGILLAAWFGPSVRAGVLIEQTFPLRPGWNSIYLEVEPDQNDVPTVFAGLPVASVWTRIPRTSSAEYIQDPSERLLDRSGWLVWIPGQPGFLTNLFRVQANRAYFVRLDGDQDVLLTVTGRPSLRNIEWSPDAPLLTGLPVDPQSLITFADFLAPSPAHAGQPIYRVVPTGTLNPVHTAAEAIHSGEAYWIFCRGASTYTGPLGLSVDLSDDLDFGGTALEREIRIENLASRPKTFVRTLASDIRVPLSYFGLNKQGSIVWTELPPEHGIELPVEGTITFRLAVRRADFASESVESVLEVSDGAGLRRRIPVRALRREPVAGSLAQREVAGAADPFAGLWAGSVTIGAVSEAQTGSTDPTATATEFSFRLIVHVDGSGQVRLLKQVIQMWEDGTLNLDGTVSTPGRFVLLTDDRKIVDFQGAALRDGDQVGFRASTAAYDFDGNELAMVGAFDPGGQLTVDLELPPEAATHPFQHRFHPDHDNLDDRFVAFREEAFGIQRHLELQFSQTDPLGQNPPDWGDTVVGGTYRETLKGLHRNDIVSQGTFRLRRVAEMSVLNPMPGGQKP